MATGLGGVKNTRSGTPWELLNTGQEIDPRSYGVDTGKGGASIFKIDGMERPDWIPSWNDAGYGDVPLTYNDGSKSGYQQTQRKMTPQEELRNLAEMRFHQSVDQYMSGDNGKLFKPKLSGLGYALNNGGSISSPFHGGQQNYEEYNVPVIPFQDAFPGLTPGDFEQITKLGQSPQLMEMWVNGFLQNPEALAPSMESLAAGTAYGQPGYVSPATQSQQSQGFSKSLLSGAGMFDEDDAW